MIQSDEQVNKIYCHGSHTTKHIADRAEKVNGFSGKMNEK